MASEQKSGWFGKPLVITIVLIMAQLLFMVSLVAPESLENTIEAELDMMVSAYGEKSTKEIYSQALDSTTAILDDSGAMEWLRTVLLPREYLQTGGVSDTQNFNSSFWTVVDNAIQNLALNVEFTMLRIKSFGQWIYMFVIMVIAAVMTGYFKREIKKQGFDYSSPLRHGLSRKWIYFTPVMIYLVVVTPFAFHPYIFPLLIGILSFAISMYVANTIKRV